MGAWFGGLENNFSHLKCFLRSLHLASAAVASLSLFTLGSRTGAYGGVGTPIIREMVMLGRYGICIGKGN